MESVKKIIEKEEEKRKKNPGKANREQRKESNRAKRGDPIPRNRIVESRKNKQRRRERLKKDLQKSLKDI